MNMALDELLLKFALGESCPALRFYSWSEPSASYGYSQSPGAVRRSGLTLVRRPTGGGVVYHENELTYSLAIPAGHWLASLDRLQSYKKIHEAMLPAFGRFGAEAFLAPDSGERLDRASLQCFVSPSPYDIVSSSGKLAGAAQRRTKEGILQQGSVSLSASSGDRETLLDAIVSALSASLSIDFKNCSPPIALLDSAASLAKIKYASDSWNAGKPAESGATEVRAQ